MFRVLLVALWVSVVVYALVDWLRTAEDEMPGRLPKALWLILIVLTAPSFALGALVWIGLRFIRRAEVAQASGEGVSFLGRFGVDGRRSVRSAGDVVVAPDDDPEFLFKLERDIARHRAEQRDEDARKERLSKGLGKMSDNGQDSAQIEDLPEEKEEG